MTSPSIMVSDVGVEFAAVDPDARALRGDLQGAAFTFGVDAGWWRTVRWAFPYVEIAITAAPRADAPTEFLFRFECTQYPQQAPLALVWDTTTDQPSAQPKRPIGRDQVKLVFRTDWEGQYLYTPFDRYALSKHPDWVRNNARTAWNPTFTIFNYLKHLHDLLHSSSYTGVARP